MQGDDFVIAVILIGAIGGVLAVGILLFVTLYRRAQINLQMERERFREVLLESEREITQNNLKSIASELHDNYGQVISLIKLNLSSLKVEDKDVEKADECTKMLSTLLRDIRHFSREIKEDRFTQLSLSELIENDLRSIRRSGLFKTELINTGELPALKTEFKLVVYRIFQELSQNAIKHSEAEHLWVNLKIADSKLVLSVTDDGRGFEPETAVKGQGLHNLKNRCASLGANLSLKSKPGEGSCSLVEVPLHHDLETISQTN